MVNFQGGNQWKSSRKSLVYKVPKHFSHATCTSLETFADALMVYQAVDKHWTLPMLKLVDYVAQTCKSPKWWMIFKAEQALCTLHVCCWETSWNTTVYYTELKNKYSRKLKEHLQCILYAFQAVCEYKIHLRVWQAACMRTLTQESPCVSRTVSQSPTQVYINPLGAMGIYIRCMNN